MNAQQIIEYCLKKPCAYLDYPYKGDPACVRIRAGEKRPVFVQLWDSPSERNVTVRTTPTMADFYRSAYPKTIRRGYYCPPIMQPYWNTIAVDENWHSEVPEEELIEMLDFAYEAALERLPKYLQKQVRETKKLSEEENV